ncbi:MAG: NUDIX domain-containing protein [Gammaproteobacteria bacterium]|nr:NUDIX domain-containing protein [Gammaproteobacteria bacterium]
MTGFRFCPGCGGESLLVESAKSFRCTVCGFRYFHNVAVAVAVLIRVEDELLFARRAHAPAAGLLDFPGGFVDADETLEQAAVRELAEELGLEVDPGALRYAFSGCNRYPFAGVTYLTSDAFFLLPLPERPTLRCADDVAEALWRPLGDIPWAELAFPTVARAVERLLEDEG